MSAAKPFFGWGGPARNLIQGFKQRLPWQLKMVGKILMARLPVSYRFWADLSLTKHGDMDVPEYAYATFRKHFERSEFVRKKFQDFVMLELGPGDSLFSALIAKVLGASEVYLVDAGPHARRDLGCYQDMLDFLRKTGFGTNSLDKHRSLDQLLEACSAHYYTQGVHSLRQIASGSVDFIWSNTVLQHVRRHDLVPLLAELRRVQRPDGLSSHSIDLRDHLGAGLNNLRFKESFWEADFISSSGFYTNRVRCAEWLDLFRNAGFTPRVLETQRWPALPTPRKMLAPPFRDLPEEELCISWLEVLLH